MSSKSRSGKEWTPPSASRIDSLISARCRQDPLHAGQNDRASSSWRPRPGGLIHKAALRPGATRLLERVYVVDAEHRRPVRDDKRALWTAGPFGKDDTMARFSLLEPVEAVDHQGGQPTQRRSFATRKQCHPQFLSLGQGSVMSHNDATRGLLPSAGGETGTQLASAAETKDLCGGQYSTLRME
jgi:hypothetical protein